MRVIAVDDRELTPFEMPDRFRMEVVYFMTPAGDQGVPDLASGEYWIRQEDSKRWLDDGTFSIVSPLDAASKAEIELSEEQESWLEWMVENGIQHIRLE